MNHPTALYKSGAHVAQQPPAQRQHISSAPAFNSAQQTNMVACVIAGACPGGVRQHSPRADAKIQHVFSHYVRALPLAMEAYVHWIELRGNAVLQLLLGD